MAFKDRLIKCSECGTDFVFRVEEQRRMAAEGDIDVPQLCGVCRADGQRNGKLTGSVKWFDPIKGYGFIRCDDGRGEVFVHRSGIQYVGTKVLYEGESVEFDLEYDPQGEKAVNVTGHDPFAP